MLIKNKLVIFFETQMYNCLAFIVNALLILLLATFLFYFFNIFYNDQSDLYFLYSNDVY